MRLNPLILSIPARFVSLRPVGFLSGLSRWFLPGQESLFLSRTGLIFSIRDFLRLPARWITWLEASLITRRLVPRLRRSSCRSLSRELLWRWLIISLVSILMVLSRLLLRSNPLVL